MVVGFLKLWCSRINFAMFVLCLVMYAFNTGCIKRRFRIADYKTHLTGVE